jgi:hypothetical protein
MMMKSGKNITIKKLLLKFDLKNINGRKQIDTKTAPNMQFLRAVLPSLIRSSELLAVAISDSTFKVVNIDKNVEVSTRYPNKLMASTGYSLVKTGNANTPAICEMKALAEIQLMAFIFFQKICAFIF